MTYGQFAFTTTEAGNYLACFWLDHKLERQGVTLGLDWKIGIAAKDWESVAKKEKIEVLLDSDASSIAVNSFFEVLIHYHIIFYRELNLCSEDWKTQFKPFMAI